MVRVWGRVCSTLSAKLGMFPLVLTVLNKDSSNPLL